MSRYSVLVDSSVWIAYFKSGGIRKLEQKSTLFSFDKHFKLMQKHLNFDLITK